ncbi:2-methylcitrate dehydratase PrpD [Lipingzhangella halophila]|uniref:2-methylcitrate dehydratase PrpD n=1 Tax=Lipingzhangella halophila TaxID=1783352 RepID=A0A7W7RJY6_9ACTN|nr:MmgE/PrpD family protein [Lipingzhangella halophila]MBB4932891.1 2-methylcitrate dehydratase PrpD [Lipingzhangella halophila]
MTGLTTRLARWVASARFDDLPGDVVDRTERHLLDALAAAVVGHDRPWTRRVRAYAAAESPSGRSIAVPTGPELRPEWAALVNGTAMHGFEIDDYALPGLSHPSCAVVPAALALAQETGCDGRRLLTALAVGYEITVRFGRATTPSLTSDRGFHVTSALGVFGAAATAAALCGLGEENTHAAFGIAASLAGGTAEFTRTGGDVKRLHGGFAASAGVRAAALARAGLTGPTAAVEGERGFLAAFVENARPGQLTDGLGRDWASVDLGIKPLCVCAGLQAPLAALDELIEREDIGRQEIHEVRVGLDEPTLAHVGRLGPRPADLTEAQLSLHHAVATRLVLGGNDPAHYRAFEEGREPPEVAEVGRRVAGHLDPRSDEVFPERVLATVTLRLANGRELSARSEAPGSPRRPLGAGEVRAKFGRLVAPVLGEGATDRVAERVAALRTDSDADAVLAPMWKTVATPVRQTGEPGQ